MTSLVREVKSMWKQSISSEQITSSFMSRSVDNSKEHVHVDYIIFTVVQSDDCKESVVFLF